MDESSCRDPGEGTEAAQAHTLGKWGVRGEGPQLLDHPEGFWGRSHGKEGPYLWPAELPLGSNEARAELWKVHMWREIVGCQAAGGNSGVGIRGKGTMA